MIYSWLSLEFAGPNVQTARITVPAVKLRSLFDIYEEFVIQGD